MNIDGFSPNMVKECIVQDAKRKVILKFQDGDVQVAVAEEGDEYNPEVGILWATMKHLMKKYGICSAHKYVQACLEKDVNRKTCRGTKNKNDGDDKSPSETAKSSGKKAKIRQGLGSDKDLSDDSNDNSDDDFVDGDFKFYVKNSIPKGIVYCHPYTVFQIISLLDSI